MHCGVMVTGANQGDRDRLLQGDYARPPTVSDAKNMEDTCSMGALGGPLGCDSSGATHRARRFGLLDAAAPPALPGLLGGTPPRVAMGTAVTVAPGWKPGRPARSQVNREAG